MKQLQDLPILTCKSTSSPANIWIIKMLTLNFDSESEQKLGVIAQKAGKNIEQLLMDLALDYLDDLHDAFLADKAIDELINGEDSTISLEDWGRQLNDMEN
jgi:predicted DNA-binding protein